MQNSCDIKAPLPIIPRSLLRQKHAFVASDDRFRAAARLLQASWRAGAALAAGSIRTRRGGTRRIGSMLTAADAAAGRNFILPSIARLAHAVLAYREPGALIHQQRLFANALSSQTLALNLFGPLVLDLGFAAGVLRMLLPMVPIARVLHIGFEHSPGRGAAELTEDNTAFDVAIAYERPDGQRGLIAIEVKYSETLAGAVPPDRTRYDDLAQAAGLFKEPSSALLRFTGLRQLYREHLLAQAAVMRGDWSEAHFVLIGPRENISVTRAANLYAAHLAEVLPGHVPFSFITLQSVIKAIEQAGGTEQAAALHERYTDWSKVDRLVADALTGVSKLTLPGR